MSDSKNPKVVEPASRKPYVRPEVVEYAPLTDLTLISPCPPLPC